MRRCVCGCGASLDGRSPRARYVSDAHRARGWKEATGYTHPGRSSRRNGRNGALRGRGGILVSYYRALKAFTAMTGLEDHEIERALRAALSDR